VTFAPGERERAIAVAVVGDGDPEPDETFAVELSDPVGATTGDGRGVGTILDDDAPPPALSIVDAIVVEGTGGRTTAVLDVTLSRPARGPVVFDWATADGSAQAPADYVAAAGTGLIPAGATRTTVGVTVEGDVEVEQEETLAVELSGIVGAEAGDTSATLAIADDDACVPGLVWEYVELEGCFVPEGGAFRAEGDVRLNGVELRRETSSVEIVADPIGRRVHARGGKVQLRVGGLTLPSADLDVTTPADNGEEAVFVTGVLVPPTAFVYLKGLAVTGPVRLRLTRARESRLELPVGIPLVPLAKIGDTWLKGEAVLVSDNERGLRSDSVKVIAEQLPIGPVLVKRLAIGWDELRQRWEGDATVVVPTPEALELSAGFAFEGGRFAGASGGADNLNVPIGGGVFLQAVSFAVEFDPLELEGGIGISAGPVVAGKTALRVDGTFGIRFDDPLAVRVRGLLSLVDVPLGAAWFDYYSSGTVEFGGRLELRLPDQEALLSPVYVEGVLRGWVDGSAGFAAYAGARVDVLGLTLAGAEVLVSNVGIAACGKVTWLEAGFGYRWETGELAVMGPWACSVGGYEPVLERPGAAAGVAATPVALSLPASERGLVLKLHGDGGAPRVTLAGPGGRSVTTPAGDGEPLANDEFVVLQDEAAETTIVAIRRPRGEWTLTELPGSPPVTQVEQAAVLPEPSVDAAVRGPRDEPELAWRLEPRDGQVVTFVEEGSEVARVLGRTAEASGRMAFDPAEGPAGERRIVALVEQDGLLRERVVAATFTAQAPGVDPGASPARKRVSALRADVARERLAHGTRTALLDPLRAAARALARKPSDPAAACAALARFRDAVEASPGIPAATAAAWLAEAGAIRVELGC
jgi:hypothetical protein